MTSRSAVAAFLAAGLAVVLAVGLALVPATATAGTAGAAVRVTPGYGTQATVVAKRIGCTDPRLRTGDTGVIHSGVVCDLDGRRVNVITFGSARQQARWVRLFPAAVPAGRTGHFARIAGVVGVARNVTRPPARVAAKALGGRVVSRASVW